MSNLALINQNEFAEENYSFEELSNELAMLTDQTMTLDNNFYDNRVLIEKLKMLTSDLSDEIKKAVKDLSNLYDEAKETAGMVDAHAFSAEIMMWRFNERKMLVH